MAGFARARVENLIRTAGAFRVSAGAIDRLNEVLTDYAMTIAKYSVEVANYDYCKIFSRSRKALWS